MLRSIGAQIEKTTNREACRDLSGRRMRDINNEKRFVVLLNIPVTLTLTLIYRKYSNIIHMLV